MKVTIKKVHRAWNEIYPNAFKIGDEVELSGNIVTTKEGLKFNADDLCKCFSNHCSYSDIFNK